MHLNEWGWMGQLDIVFFELKTAVFKLVEWLCLCL